MTIQNLIVFVIVIVCIALLGRHIYRTFTQKGKCNCGCSNCKYSSKSSECESKDKKKD